jgi:hypothetical protein
MPMASASEACESRNPGHPSPRKKSPAVTMSKGRESHESHAMRLAKSPMASAFFTRVSSLARTPVKKSRRPTLGRAEATRRKSATLSVVLSAAKDPIALLTRRPASCVRKRHQVLRCAQDDRKDGLAFSPSVVVCEGRACSGASRASSCTAHCARPRRKPIRGNGRDKQPANRRAIHGPLPGKHSYRSLYPQARAPGKPHPEERAKRASRRVAARTASVAHPSRRGPAGRSSG